jgi:hypothetical protein
MARLQPYDPTNPEANPDLHPNNLDKRIKVDSEPQEKETCKEFPVEGC